MYDDLNSYSNNLIFKKLFDIDYPVVGLSPMDGITNSIFRQIVKKNGNPDIMFTEFEHVTAIINALENVIDTLSYTEEERPIIAQIYGSNPEHFYHVAKLICALGFDGIDINMGCPAKNVVNSNAGAGLIRQPNLALEIIKSVKQGVEDWVKTQQISGFNEKKLETITKLIQMKQSYVKLIYNNKQIIYPGILNLINQQKVKIPVSVKTRIGYDVPITEKWISTLDKVKPDWISIHGRTLKQMYAPYAKWDEIAIGVKSTSAPVLANGDIRTKNDVDRVLEITNAVGVLIGRAALENPIVFRNIKNTSNNREDTELNTIKQKIISIIYEHAKKFFEVYGNKNFVQMRKHFGWYAKYVGINKETRIKLIQVSSFEEFEQLFKQEIIQTVFTN
ncbi:MAG: tRNA-dihydrouridine synthase family protein [Candidatus Dojkabacteria bacterium]|nr:tRNA-dihydrouridine synthase family protein [Candidatus Dojkabacteria bacterium]